MSFLSVVVVAHVTGSYNPSYNEPVKGTCTSSFVVLRDWVGVWGVYWISYATSYDVAARGGESQAGFGGRGRGMRALSPKAPLSASADRSRLGRGVVVERPVRPSAKTVTPTAASAAARAGRSANGDGISHRRKAYRKLYLYSSCGG